MFANWIAKAQKIIGKWLPVFAKADDIAEEFFKVAGKLEVYADAKEKVIDTVRGKTKAIEESVAVQLETLGTQKAELKVEVAKAKVLAGKIRNILED